WPQVLDFFGEPLASVWAAEKLAECLYTNERSAPTLQRNTRESSPDQEDQRHELDDQGLLRLCLTLLLPGGVSAARSGGGKGGRGRVDAVRVTARTAPDAAARRGLPPAGLGAVGLPHRPPDGRADPPAAGVTPAAHAPGVRGLPVRQGTRQG